MSKKKIGKNLRKKNVFVSLLENILRFNITSKILTYFKIKSLLKYGNRFIH